MNAFAIILSLLNVTLLTASVGGIFLDMPAREELANKERVYVALMKTVSERDAEIIAVKKRKEELEREIPRMPNKIKEANEALKMQTSGFAEKKSAKEKASTTLAFLQKKNAEKERELARLLERNFSQGKKGTTVFFMTFSAPKEEDLNIREVSVRDSLRLSDGGIARDENAESGFAASNAIPRLELWDSEKRLAEATQNGDGTFSFLFADDKRFTVQKGSSKTFFIKADISSSAKTGELHRIVFLNADVQPAQPLRNIEKNDPIFILGNASTPTIALGEMTRTEGKIGDSMSVKWSMLNVPRTAKVAILFEDSDGKQTVLAKDLAAFSRRANIKILSLSAGSYSVVVVAYEGDDFCIDCKGATAPMIVATGKGDAKFQIVGAE